MTIEALLLYMHVGDQHRTVVGDEDVVKVDEGEDQILYPLAFGNPELHFLGRKVLWELPQAKWCNDGGFGN